MNKKQMFKKAHFEFWAGIILLSILTLSPLHAQITVDFTYTDSVGCGSVPVTFCDNSTSTVGNIVSYSWDLGGVPVNQECPSRIFGIPGTYDICLTVEDDQGNSETLCRNGLIRVLNLPQPDFSADDVTGCVPMTVEYRDQSVSSDGTITTWLWGLGGPCGTVLGGGASPDATCTYAIPDSYNISLTITDDNGCTNTITKTDYIQASARPPVDVQVNTGFGCDPPFQASFTNNSPLTNVNFNWDFGNNETFTGANPPPVVYNDFGSYTVTVIAENTQTGCTDTLVLENAVNIGNDVEFTVSTESICQDEAVSFTDISSLPADSVRWTFGDGTQSTAFNPAHIYTAPGCYTVTLVRHVDGCASTFQYPNCIQVNALPNVSYNNNNSIGCSLPHVVNFAGIPQSGDIVSWEWDFGDSNTSTEQNPVHSYNSFGNFIVTLTVTNSDGCSFSFSNNPIVVLELSAAIISPAQSGCAPLNVTLQESSMSIAPINSWTWSVQTQSNTYISNDEQGQLTIPDTGVFDVVLIVENVLGCRDTVTVEDLIEVGEPPVVDFVSSTQEECIEVPIDFTDLSSANGESWLWSFGDGEESVAQFPTHEYQDTGFYDITLTVTHNGCSNSVTFPDYIQIKEPLAKFNVLQSCDDILRVEFVDRSVGAETVFWDFGVTTETTDTTSERSPVYVFPGPGVYAVTQTAFNSTTNCEHSTTIEVTIADPMANFTFSPGSGCSPVTLTINDLSQWADRWFWLAPGGDISNFSAPEPNITYTTPGAYSDIRLIIVDVNGCLDTFLNTTDTVYVNGIDVDLAFTPESGCGPLEVNFSDLSSNLFGTNSNWTWQFGDGLGESFDQSPTFTFEENGFYDVSLVVRDDLGCSASLTIDSAIQVIRPTAAFSAVDTLSCTTHCVAFDNPSIGNNLTYSWDFGDGNTSTLPSPTHCYRAEGTYTVCLTVTDDQGCTDQLCRTDYIEIIDPVAAFTTDVTSSTCPPLEVNFTNNSINADTVFWDFGDGSGMTSIENPTHIYNNSGMYDVQLIAGNTEFCFDTLTLTDLIQINGPDGNFSYSIDSTCVPLRVTFFAEATAPFFLVWDFGDGNVDTSDVPMMLDTVVHVYTTEGQFFPVLQIIDGSGCSHVVADQVGIQASRIDTDFQTAQQQFCGDGTPGPITFSNLSFSFAPLTFQWEFPGATPASSNAIEPTVTYSAPGSYDVMLIASNGFCTDTLFQPGYIGIGPEPEAGFVMSTREGCEPLEVNFINSSTVSSGNVVEWLWDFGDGSSSTEANPTHIFTEGEDIPVTLIVTTDAGCQDTLIDFVNVLPLQPMSAGPDREICINEAVQLEAIIFGDDAGLTYSWSPATDLSCTDCPNPIASPSDTIVYTLTVFSRQGCPSSDDVQVNVKPFTAPVITLSNDTLICPNEFVQLFVSGGIDIFDYNWDSSREGLTCYENCRNPIASPSVSTNYIVSVTNDFGCTSVDSVSVQVRGITEGFAGADRTICEGGTVQLNAGAGTDPVWESRLGISCINCPDPFASPDSTTDYVVRITTPDGCENLDTVRVNVLNLDEVEAGADVRICIGDDTVLSGTGIGTISWSPAASLDDPSILNPIATPTSTTTYYLTTGNDLCVLTDSIRVEVSDQTSVSGVDVTICEGDTVALQVIGPADVYDWSLSDGSVSNSMAESPEVAPTVTTTYTVVAQQSTCAPDTAVLVVEVDPAPIIELLPVRSFMPGQLVALNTLTPNNPDYTYEWAFSPDLTCLDCPYPTAQADTSTQYTVRVTDELTGCSDEYSIQLVELEDCPEELIGVPNIFTPNDDGQNDEFQLFLSGALQEGITSLRIYSRWGELVFETGDFSQGWDGNFKGNKMPTGVYQYVIEAPCQVSGRTILKVGDVTLVR
ncbi:MAG: PKD domain-containing protein [Bacteroidota bacterium]